MIPCVTSWMGSHGIGGKRGRNSVQRLHWRVRQNNLSLYLTPTDTTTQRIAYLPIFPLRKTLRLPTESLTSNLYEERYLAMATDILQQPNPSLGAMTFMNRPHMVKSGVGDIVPMVKPGDIGVVFHVESHEDDPIPTIGGDHRRRIRLEARGGLRFRVDQVLCNGFDSHTFTLANQSDSNLPYIVVSATVVHDNDMSHDEYDEALATIAKIQKKRDIDNLDPGVSLSSDAQQHFCEMATFALASEIIPESATQLRNTILNQQSTLERAAFLLQL
jgi:Lon protease-like protein